MYFPVNLNKAADVTARLLEQAGGPLDADRIAVLAYLVDRERLLIHGVPVIGGPYAAVPGRGPSSMPVHGLSYRLPHPRFDTLIAFRPREASPYGGALESRTASNYDCLSPAELREVDAVARTHAGRTDPQLEAWCLAHCSEYGRLANGPGQHIELTDMLAAAGRTPEKIRRVLALAAELGFLQTLLG